MKKLTLFISVPLFLMMNVSQAWALPNCVGDWSTSNWNNCFGTYTYAGGNKYVGEFKDKNYNGQGTFTFVSGDTPITNRISSGKDSFFRFVTDWYLIWKI